MSDTGRAICAPYQKLGGARVPSFRRSSLACYKFRDVFLQIWHRPGNLCPPPLLKLWEGHVLPSPFPLLIHSEMFHRLAHLCPPSQKLGGVRVLSFRRSSLVEMPDTSLFAHFTPLFNWLINASREGSRRPGALGGVKGAPGRVYRKKVYRFYMDSQVFIPKCAPSWWKRRLKCDYGIIKYYVYTHAWSHCRGGGGGGTCPRAPPPLNPPLQLVLVLIFYCVLTCLHDVKTKKHSHTTCFYFLEYDVISQLRHNYTKDLFCVTWFKHFTNI